jgi:disulfide bond formation protein DsbB
MEKSRLLGIGISVAWIGLGAGVIWIAGSEQNPYALVAGIVIEIIGLVFLYSGTWSDAYHAGVKDGHALKNYKPDLSEEDLVPEEIWDARILPPDDPDSRPRK